MTANTRVRPTNVTHVIPRLGSGGPTRSLAALIKYGGRAQLPWQHDVIVLEPAVTPNAVVQLRTAGARLHVASGTEKRTALLNDANIVIVHYWQCPSMVAFLASPRPARALTVLWAHVYGLHAPQVLSRAVVASVDQTWLSSGASRDAPPFGGHGSDLPVVPGLIDPERLVTNRAEATRGDNDARVVVGYVGTVNEQKLHPRFVELCAAVPGATFVIYGSGGGEDTLRESASQAGLGDHFDVRGHTEHVGDAYASFDVFGYPLTPFTYATSDLTVQEAMWMGVPPVVLPHGGVPLLIRDHATGFVAATDDEYVHRVHELVGDRDLRATLGTAARDHAHDHFDPAATVRHVRVLVDDARDGPARPSTRDAWPAGPAEWFVRALDTDAEGFIATLTTMPALMATGEGGLFQWRNAFPDDAQLNDWTAEVVKHR